MPRILQVSRSAGGRKMLKHGMLEVVAELEKRRRKEEAEEHEGSVSGSLKSEMGESGYSQLPGGGTVEVGDNVSVGSRSRGSRWKGHILLAERFLWYNYSKI